MKIPKFDIKIVGEITDYSLSNFIDACQGKKSINVLLFSGGGSGESAFGISDYIKSSGISINVYCIGKIESAALIILHAGKNKYSFKNCVFMYHLPVIGAGTVEDTEKHQKKIKIFTDRLKSITPKNIDLKYYPTYLTAEEALKEKIIDKIIK